MKNKLILILSILLIISASINVKLYNESKKEKSILPISEMSEVDNVNLGSVKVGKIVMSEENNNMIISAVYKPNTPGNWHIHSSERTNTLCYRRERLLSGRKRTVKKN